MTTGELQDENTLTFVECLQNHYINAIWKKKSYLDLWYVWEGLISNFNSQFNLF